MSNAIEKRTNPQRNTGAGGSNAASSDSDKARVTR